jgi:hypothetical protein
VSTIDSELLDAFLNAPTGLYGLAADMADLAEREPANDRYAHLNKPAVPDAIQAGQDWAAPQDARVIIERVNALADKWERVGNGYVSLPVAACDLRLALARHPRRRTPGRPRNTCR